MSSEMLTETREWSLEMAGGELFATLLFLGAHFAISVTTRQSAWNSVASGSSRPHGKRTALARKPGAENDSENEFHRLSNPALHTPPNPAS